jgi:hypothetical protein
MEASSGTSLTFNVATDGAKNSDDVFTLITENLMKPNDKIVVSHIYDSGKSYLPRYMQFSYL